MVKAKNHQTYIVDIFDAPEPHYPNARHEVWRDEEGKLHRLRGLPAETITDLNTGVIIEQSFYENGKLHCDAGPAFIRRSAKHNRLMREDYFQRGERSRHDGPSTTIYNPEDGEIKSSSHYLHGVPFDLDQTSDPSP